VHSPGVASDIERNPPSIPGRAILITAASAAVEAGQWQL
jgi:hypothetical protein